jgi:hypothetical protein
VGGVSGPEDIAGSLTVNRDCTASATIEVFVNGQLQRTAILALIFDRNQNHSRGLFESLTLSDNTNIPVVLTIEAERVFPEH